jgi:fanconi anemia group J protein
MDIQLDGACVILDEAHNIEDACREAASLLIDYDALQEGAGECSAFTTTIHKEVFDPLALLLHNLAGWVHARKDELVKLEFTVSSKEYNVCRRLISIRMLVRCVVILTC